jgi:hypothetical protein
MQQVVFGGSPEPHSAVAAERSPAPDRSMQVLEYFVALIAVLAAVALAFLR